MIEAIVLAGGRGTRLRGEVPDLPKPLAPVGGRPFLELLLDSWIARGVERFCLAVGYRAERIQRHLGDSYRGASIRYSVEERPLGTGGAFARALRGCEPGPDPVLVVNGDTLAELDLDGMARSHRAARADWTLALYSPDVREGRADRWELDSEGWVRGFSPAGWAGGGVCLASRELARAPWLTETHSSLERDIVLELIRKGGKVQGFRCEGKFIDIGLPVAYRAAEAEARSLCLR